MDVLSSLRKEKRTGIPDGIYGTTRLHFAYHSNTIEGAQLSIDQVRSIIGNNELQTGEHAVSVDDVIEMRNHAIAFDLIIDRSEEPLSEELIKELHRVLKSSTIDAQQAWFALGDYKRIENVVGGQETAAPEHVASLIQNLVRTYAKIKAATLDDLIAFHVQFERIHPFQDGNGRVGRLILFKECLRFGIVPFIISLDEAPFYLRGIRAWDHERGYLRDTCLSAQDRYTTYLDYFGIDYPKDIAN